MNKLGFTVALLIVACGTPPAPRDPAPIVIPSASIAAPPSAPKPKVVAYLAVYPAWVSSYVVVDDATLRAWGADPANAKRLLPPTRHVLVRLDKDATPVTAAAAKKKAEALLARAKKGEDFAKLAKESDDPGSKDKGGMYPGEMVKNFVTEFRTVYERLAPGQVEPTLVRTVYGWHVIKKDAIDDATIREAYTRLRAIELAHTIADEMGEKIDARGSTNGVLSARLGVKASSDPERPLVRAMAELGPDASSACSELEHRAKESDKAVVLQIGYGDEVAWLVAKTLEDDVVADVEDGACSRQSREVTPERIRKLIEHLQQQKQGAN